MGVELNLITKYFLVHAPNVMNLTPDKSVRGCFIRLILNAMGATRKRYHDVYLWRNSWFISLPNKEKLLWYFINSECDHGGLWSPVPSIFSGIVDSKTDLDQSLALFNSKSEHVVILENGEWLLVDFFKFQYGKKMNLNNRVHMSVKDIYVDFQVPLNKTGITEVENPDVYLLELIESQNMQDYIKVLRS